jgi:hypothetical protein
MNFIKLSVFCIYILRVDYDIDKIYYLFNKYEKEEKNCFYLRLEGVFFINFFSLEINTTIINNKSLYDDVKLYL